MKKDKNIQKELPSNLQNPSFQPIQDCQISAPLSEINLCPQNHLFAHETPPQSSKLIKSEKSQIQFTSQTIHELNGAFEKLKIFMNSLGQIKLSVLRHSVLSHITNADEKYEKVNYREVQQNAQFRVQRMNKTKRLKKSWGLSDLKMLVWIIGKYCEKNKIRDVEKGIKEEDWKQITSMVPGATTSQCMFKWLNMKVNKIRDQKWQKNQQKLMENIIRDQGQINWQVISKKLYLLNDDPDKLFRSAKHCKEHWNCFLSPLVKKGNWTQEEDQKLIELISEFQNTNKKHWVRLVSHFEGRTENALKNRYFFILKKETEKQKQLTEQERLKAVIKKIRQKKERAKNIKQFTDNQQKEGDKIPEKEQFQIRQYKNLTQQNMEALKKTSSQVYFALVNDEKIMKVQKSLSFSKKQK